MAWWFFMSYARADDQARDAGLVRDFYDDLNAEVASRVEDQSPPIGYFDEANLEPGDPWPNEIADALRNCRTFLAIMTARYFTREYCGREWTIFEDRSRTLGGSKPAPLIIPILWVPPAEGVLPEFATDLQMKFDPKVALEEERAALADYAKYGLLHIAKRKKTPPYSNAYETILEQLAVRIISVATQHRLTPLAASGLKSLKEASNRFAGGPQVLAEPAGPSSVAHFAFVAGRNAEMSSLRPDAHRYYGQGPIEWMPYAPDERVAVALLAQAVAMDKQLIVDWMPIGPGLMTLLENAERTNSVAVMIVDPWTARHPNYRALLEQFDRAQFRNCVVLIAWNKADPQTKATFDELTDGMQQTLSRNYGGRKEVYFRPIYDRATLSTEMARAVTDLEALLAPYREPARTTAESDHKEPPPMDASGRSSAGSPPS